MGLRRGTGCVGRRLVGVAAREPALDELEVVVDGRRRRLELVPGGGHQPFEAEAHRPFRHVADRDHPAPRPILRGQRFGDGLEPAPLPVRIVDREFDPEPLTAGRASLRPVLLAEGQPCDVFEDDLLRRPAEQAVVDDVGGDGPALVIDRDYRIADARQDRAKAVLLHLGLALLLLDGDRLDAQLLGPRREVLVGDAELLDGGRQLLVERLELLVGRLELLVEGLDLLAAGLGVLARAEHGRVGAAQVGDERGQLVVGAEEALIDRCGLVEPFTGPGVAGSLPFDARDVGELDHAPTTPLPLVRYGRTVACTWRGASSDDVGRLDLIDRRTGLALERQFDGVADLGGRQRVGEVHEVLVEGRAVDAQDPPGGGIDADDVVAPIDHDHTDVEAEQDPLGGCGRVRSRSAIASCRADGAVEGDGDFSSRGDHLRPDLWHGLLSGQPSVDPKPRVLLIIRARSAATVSDTPRTSLPPGRNE